MKKLSVILVVIALVISIAGCAKTKTTMGYDSLYNPTLGKVISLGDSKDNIEKVLGQGRRSAEYGFYDYGDFSVRYIDGKATRFFVITRDWQTKNKISSNTTLEDLLNIEGDPHEIDDQIRYYLYDNRTVCAGFIVQNEKVVHYFIYSQYDQVAT